jgi:phage shock protein PspC (stress-responsive transcriptional regulator)
MSHTTTTTAPPAPAETERRLVRPTDDRLLGGVCAGLGRYFEMSPLVYRVAFAALALLGGAGILLYLAAWIVIPDERRGDSLAGEALRSRRDRPWLAVGVGLVGAGLLIGIAESRIWPDPGGVWVAALALGLAIVWWQLRARDEAAQQPPAAGSSPVGREEPAVTVAAAASESGEGTAAAQPAAPPRRRLPVGLTTFGVILVGAGVLGLLEATGAAEVDWAVALAAAVVVVGIAVAVGAFLGGAGALAVFGALLAAVMLVVVSIDLPLQGPVGDRTERPAALVELDRTYEQSIGTLTLDLSALSLPTGTTTVSASTGIGELVVEVPDGVRVEVSSSVTAGESRLFGVSEDGWRVEQSAVSEGAGVGSPTLELDATVGLGSLEVRRG